MYTSTVALWRAGAAVLSYTQNKISSHLAPGKNVGFTYDGCRWRPQIFDIRYLFISLLSDLCCSAELPEVEIISLIEEKIPRYKLRADSAISFTGNIILLFTFSLVFFFLSFLYNSSFFFLLYNTNKSLVRPSVMSMSIGGQQSGLSRLTRIAGIDTYKTKSKLSSICWRARF